MNEATRAARRRRMVRVAFGLAALLAPRPASALEFRDASAGMSMRVPDDWRRLSDAELAALVATLPGPVRPSRVHHLVAFRPASSDAYPTLLVTELSIKRASLRGLAKSLERLQGSDKLREVLESADAGDVELGAPMVDERRRLVLSESRRPSETPDGDELVTLCAMLPGRASVLQLTMYCADDAPRTRKTFDAILDTFRFDADRGYSPQDQDDGWKVLLMLFVLGGAIYRRTRKGRRPAPRPGELDAERGRTRQGPPEVDPRTFLAP